MICKAWLVASFLLILCGCSGAMKYPDSPNFNKQTARFQHPKGDLHDKTFVEFFKFFSAYVTRQVDETENTGFPVSISAKEELANFRENVMWVGHSTLLLNHSDVTIMTDPQFSDRASPFSFMGPKRVTLLPFQIADLPRIDAVVISHNHYDHLDTATMKCARRRAAVFARCAAARSSGTRTRIPFSSCRWAWPAGFTGSTPRRTAWSSSPKLLPREASERGQAGPEAGGATGHSGLERARGRRSAGHWRHGGGGRQPD